MCFWDRYRDNLHSIEGGRATGYLESEINEFINARIEQSRREVKS